MWLLYLLALLPAIIGAVLWVMHKRIVWWEWAIGVALGFLTAVIIHGFTLKAMTADTETWSGMVNRAVHMPQWVAGEWETHYTYDSEGNVTGSYQTYDTWRVGPDWWVETTLGRIDIGKAKYAELLKNFGNVQQQVRGRRPSYDSGPKEDWVTVNKSGWIEPVNALKSWENRVKASPSLFDFQEVPDDAPVFKYPENDTFRSNRLLGRARFISTLEFDRLNARLGAAKKVNLIMIGFSIDADTSIAHFQEAAWIGGKKNDLVICFGGGNKNKAGWAYVFGWTEKPMVKRTIESLLLTKPIDDNLLRDIENAVRTHYTIKEWDEFNYLALDPPWWSYLTLVIVLVITQGGFYIYAFANEHEEGGNKNLRRYHIYRR